MFDKLIESRRAGADEAVFTPMALIACAALAIAVPRVGAVAVDSVVERLSVMGLYGLNDRYRWECETPVPDRFAVQARALVGQYSPQTPNIDAPAPVGSHSTIETLATFNVDGDFIRINSEPYYEWWGADFEQARNSALFSFQTEEPATLVLGFTPPEYPQVLSVAGQSGAVTAQFVVDATGHVELASILIVDASADAFEYSVLAALQEMRFRPARLNGIERRMLVQLTFHFIARSVGDASAGPNESK